MFRIGLLGTASLLLAGPAFAAPLHPALDVSQGAPLVRAHMVCDDDGNCYRTHPRRYVEPRYYEDDEDDEYDDAHQRRYYRPRYYAPQVGVYGGYGYYSRPAFGFSIGASPW